VILIDTSGLLSAMFADQQHHEACARVLREAGPPRVLSPYVLAEADYLIQKYGGVDAELAFLNEVARGAYDLPFFDNHEIQHAHAVALKYRNLKIGLADASLVVLAARYSCRDVLTLDERHFRAIKAPGRRNFRILPADA
jgi:predicted nucleic acid-binding protein